MLERLLAVNFGAGLTRLPAACATFCSASPNPTGKNTPLFHLLSNGIAGALRVWPKPVIFEELALGALAAPPQGHRTTSLLLA